MPIPILSGDFVYQHPDDRVVYQIAGTANPPSIEKQERLKPKGDGQELRVQPTADGLLVSKGIDGANYQVTLTDGARLQLRITSKGVERTSLVGTDAEGRPIGKVDLLCPMVKGKVIVSVGQEYKHVAIDGASSPSPIVAPSRAGR